MWGGALGAVEIQGVQWGGPLGAVQIELNSRGCSGCSEDAVEIRRCGAVTGCKLSRVEIQVGSEAVVTGGGSLECSCSGHSGEQWEDHSVP